MILLIGFSDDDEEGRGAGIISPHEDDGFLAIDAEDWKVRVAPIFVGLAKAGKAC